MLARTLSRLVYSLAYLGSQQLREKKYCTRIFITQRDLKPDNIFIKDGNCKLGDFGLSSQKNMLTTELGTPLYKAPE